MNKVGKECTDMLCVGVSNQITRVRGTNNTCKGVWVVNKWHQEEGCSGCQCSDHHV